MKQSETTLTIDTHGRGFTDITRDVNQWLQSTGMQLGVLTVFVQHTSASLTIQENADPDVLADLTDALAAIAPESHSLYRHSAEGPDDMPAHIKASLTDVSLTIPFAGGRMRLGTWQGLYLIEHRTSPHRRRIICHAMGS